MTPSDKKPQHLFKEAVFITAKLMRHQGLRSIFLVTFPAHIKQNTKKNVFFALGPVVSSYITYKTKKKPFVGLIIPVKTH